MTEKERTDAKVRAARESWRKRYESEMAKAEPGPSSGAVEPREPLYDATDVAAAMGEARDLGYPGEYPFTRGVYPSMYRGKLWTMRQFSGFGSARDTNRRYKFLLEHGQTGLSVAFDMPTLMGYDSDDPHAEGEVGHCGVAISSLRDMEVLFDDIPLDRVSTSMTINGPAAILFAFYIAVAEKQGVPIQKLRGTIQNDILKEYIAQKEYLFPPAPSMRLVVDSVTYCTASLPKWHPISISGYHIREKGSTALQELAFTLADGFAYVEAATKSGLAIDDFAPQLSFFFDSHNDFFEEIAKFRAARRIWARHMRERFGAKNPRSWLMRFHTQTAGCSLMAQQPEINIVRTAFQAMAGVLGGTQSLHTNAMDETFALPTEKAAKIALRTQQVLGYETGVAEVIDPLAGSYFVESLTKQMEDGAEAHFKKIEEMGGVIPAIEKGYFQREIERSSYEFQREVEAKKRLIVGVNAFVEEEPERIEILRIDSGMETEQRRSLKQLREHRDSRAVKQALDAVRAAARDGQNLMPRFLDAARAYATLGEIVRVLKDEFGEFLEPATF